MIENRPLQTVLTHAVLILGVAAVCFPIWMALVRSTHPGARLSHDPVRFFFDIVFSLSRTTISALTIILFIYGWNQYLWPLLMTTDAQYTTVVIGIQQMLNSGEARPVWDQIMGMAVLAMLPPVLIVLSMQKLFVKGLIEQEK
jgi:ABC-type glycerol-3-phosphate transport system permease component